MDILSSATKKFIKENKGDLDRCSEKGNQQRAWYEQATLAVNEH